ncbi:uncharacterized protein LOC113324414 [Papaver somniferum]|uniref:uncharacterized protein LOC113324414 n=1 Tax=Papaver somniferum TaxID=3469 RepID=UPI000E6F98A5|nr:uncharacterized protein LOC113324414 [Papaver somniferum]
MAYATLHIKKDVVGLITFIYRWSPSTHTAICRWGEMTITLESVAVLLNLPIAGSFHYKLSTEENSTLDAILHKAEEYDQPKKDEKCFYTWWVSQWFPTKPRPGQTLDGKLSVVASLSLWLSRDIFDDAYVKKTIRHNLFMFDINLAKGVVLPLGSLFLGSLYSYLDALAADIHTSNGYKKVESHIHIALLKACLWEHFKGYAPIPATSFSSLYGGSRILRWQNRRQKPGVRLVDFLDNVYAIDFRPWGPVHFFVVQPKTFTTTSDTVLHTDGKDMSSEEIIFLRSCIPGYVPSYFDEFLNVVPYNIDRAASQMGFDQGIPFDRPPMPSKELVSSVLDASLLATKQSLPFPPLGRKPSTTDMYRSFWREKLLAFQKFSEEIVTVPRGEPTLAILEKHKRLKPLPGKRTRDGDSGDYSTQDEGARRSKRQENRPVVFNSSHMQGTMKENALTRFARSRNAALEKSGETESLEGDDKDDVNSVGDEGSVSQSGKESDRFSELVDETVEEINLQGEANNAGNAGEATSMIVVALPSKDPPVTDKALAAHSAAGHTSACGERKYSRFIGAAPLN